MALIDKETIRAEIKRRIKFHYKEGIRVNADRIDEDEIILAWLDSLPEQPKLKPMNIPSGGGAMGTTPPKFKLDVKPEQPVIKKSNALFEECLANVDPAIRKEVSDNIDKILGRQPVEGLEEEMEKFFETMPVLEHENIFEDTFQNIARHFAEWQKAKILEWAKERYQQTISNVGCYTGHSVWAEVIEHIDKM